MPVNSPIRAMLLAALMPAALAGCAAEVTPTLPPSPTAPSPANTAPRATTPSPATTPAPPTATAGPPSPVPGRPTATAHRPTTTPAREPTAPPTIGDEWQTLHDAPLELTEVAGAAHAGEGWFAGGFDAQGRPVADVVIYDPVDERWRAGPPLPEPVHHSALVSNGSDLYLLGGYAGPGFRSPVADVRRLDAMTGRWVDVPALPAPRAAGAAAWDGQRIVYGGGVGPDRVTAAIFALEGDAWSEVGRLSSAREHFAAASDGEGMVWFLGGRSGGLQTNVGAVEVLRGDSVEALGEPLTPRSGVAAFWTPATGPCLAGGEGPEGTFAEVECIAEDGQPRTLPSLTVARHGLAAAVVPNGVVIALGGPQPGLFVSAMAELLPIGR